MKRWSGICLSSVFAGVLLQAAHAAGPARDIDWNALGSEAVTITGQYLQTDTSNPPGNEIIAAKFLKALFDKEGIENEIVESAPGRASIHARLKGDGSRKAVVLLNHLDVVPVDRQHWSIEPFGGIIKDGFIWGRGAFDMKGTGIAEAMAMIALKRQGAPLKGDVVFLGVADEEDGGLKGAGYVTKEHAGWLKNAGVVLNEGGVIFKDTTGTFYALDTAEKSPLWLKLVATGTPGHGSMPLRESAANRLVKALDRIVQYQTPIKVTPEVQQLYAATAGAKDPHFKDLRAALADPGFAAAFTRDPLRNSQVRNTISLTVMEASNKTNTIAPEASAQLDLRLLPGEDPAAVIADLKKIIADESIKVETLLSFSAGSSPASGPLFDAVTAIAAQYDPGTPVVPLLTSGFTDCHFFRDLAIPCYGFAPFAASSKGEG